ncbi:MAG TPA: phage major capsid protein [Candidatus Nocardiopsis merdipullorum]|nr:phage major capsid protein [Candidatus Nocardiopsis merdipullorum]
MAIQTTSTSASAWSPDTHVFAAQDVLPGALILDNSTVSGTILGDEPALRVATVADDTAAVVAEGAPIDEADATLGEVVVRTAKIGQLHKLSFEQWSQPNVSQVLAASAGRAITRKADELFISGTTSDASTGLTNVPGIVAGDPVTGSLDSLVDLVAQLQANGAQPTSILLSPSAWAEVRKVKTGEGAATSLLGVGATDAQPLLMGIPVRVTAALAEGTGLVVDRTAIVSATSTVNVASSEHAAFDSDSIMLRATWRIGWAAVHADRIGSFMVTAPAA